MTVGVIRKAPTCLAESIFDPSAEPFQCHLIVSSLLLDTSKHTLYRNNFFLCLYLVYEGARREKGRHGNFTRINLSSLWSCQTVIQHAYIS
jgi:hypothetical protein